MAAICVITGTRAEYGLLRPLLDAIRGNPAHRLQLAVTGSHLAKQFGETYREIEQDGYRIDARVDLELGDDSTETVARAMALATTGFVRVFTQLKPDVIALLGDRYEILAAAQAALFCRIPVAHLHGGELTEGAIDDSIRHAITALSHLHFVAAEDFRNRVIQLGQEPSTVHNVGAIGIDNVLGLKLLDRGELGKEIGFELKPPTLLVTTHSVTLDARGPRQATENLLAALDCFPDTRVLFTYAGADPGGVLINQLIDAYVARHPGRTAARASLGRVRYLSAVRHADVIIGNSSSGLIEAPALKRATVNIGDRQKGRPRASSVIDCADDSASIERAIRRALSAEFQSALKDVRSPYGGQGDTARRILDVISKTNLAKLIPKHFYDLRSTT